MFLNVITSRQHALGLCCGTNAVSFSSGLPLGPYSPQVSLSWDPDLSRLGLHLTMQNIQNYADLSRYLDTGALVILEGHATFSA